MKRKEVEYKREKKDKENKCTFNGYRCRNIGVITICGKCTHGYDIKEGVNFDCMFEQ